MHARSMRRVVRVVVTALAIIIAASAVPAEATLTIPDTSESPEGAHATALSRAPTAAEFDRAEAALRQSGTVRVIAGVRAPFTVEGRLTPEAIRRQRTAIRVAQDALTADLLGSAHRVRRRYRSIPFVALDLGRTGLAALRRSAHVTSVEIDVEKAPALNRSAEIVEAVEAFEMHRLTGNGWTIAVLDTGVDGNHPMLQGKVVEEACYSDGACPNGEDEDLTAGSGAPCTFDQEDTNDGCDHGTHVAATAAGSAVSPPTGSDLFGVARGASVMSVQVFSPRSCDDQPTETCAKAGQGDLVAGLERVLEVSDEHNIAAVNMSLGGATETTTKRCDKKNKAWKAAIDNLRSVGIATVASSGNGGMTNALGAPACISTVISVGNTNDSDDVHTTSNSASFLDLLAPGTLIRSALPEDGYGSKTGTSQAAPHVAGAFALHRSVDPDASVATILSRLQRWGTKITDDRNDVTTSRINIVQALPWPYVSISDTSVTEENGATARFSVKLSQESSETVTVRVETQDGTALAGQDYESRSVLIRFHPGTTTATFSVPIIDDSVSEGSEQFYAAITYTDGARVWPQAVATGTIYEPRPTWYPGGQEYDEQENTT